MTYFWTIQEHVPDGLGFRLFGIAHLLWLGGIVLAVLAIALTCRRWKPETVHRLLCGLTWAALLLEICKDGVLLYTGQFRPNYLPLDLCGLSIFVEFAAVRNPRPLLLEPVYSLSLPGACLALLFPNWFSLPLWNFFSLHSSCSTGCWCWCRRCCWLAGYFAPTGSGCHFVSPAWRRRVCRFRW